MTKAELIEKVTKEAGQGITKKQVNDIVEATFATLNKAIRKDKRFHFPGFGTWQVKKRQARKGRNPKTGEVVLIAPTRTVAFKPAPDFKASL